MYGFSIFVPHIDTDFSTIPIIDYWISFATSLNPNDGKGASRAYPRIKSLNLSLILWDTGPYWPPYDPTNMVSLREVFVEGTLK